MVAKAALAAIATGIEIVGKIQSMQSQKAAAKANEQMYRNEAIQRQQEAEFEVSRREKQERQIRGQQRAAAAFSGVQSGSGSALELLADSAVQAEMDKRLIERQGQLLGNRANLQADQAKLQGNLAVSQGISSIGQTLLSGSESFGRLGGMSGGSSVPLPQPKPRL